jgi:PKD domain
MMSVAAGPTHFLRARRWRVSARARVSAFLSPRVPSPRVLAPLLALAATAAFLSVHVQPVQAVILPAQTIDGPSSEITGFGGVAMAEDGTGGVVYLKRVGGVPHVFVSQYREGHWLAPIRVDTGEQFAASSPRIGAADGGQLVVVWATPFATVKDTPVQELLGATLGSGATQFQEAVVIDPDIGEGVDVSPDIAMSSTAQAYVVYRVVEQFNFNTPRLRAGDLPEQVRVAHYLGHRWTLLGTINRDPGIAMRPPTASNAPQVAIARTGDGIVVWQEPEINGIARIWARRLFGNSVDYVLPVTATSVDGKPITQDADAPSVALSLLGEAFVAYRQNAGPGSPLSGPRIFLNQLSNGESESGAEFKGAFVADPNVPGGAGARLGPPSVDINEYGDLRLLYDSNGVPQVVEGTDRGLSGTLTLGPSFSGPEEPAASVMNPQGGGVSAWVSSTPFGQPAVAVREDFPEGAVQTALIAGGAGGPISGLAVGRSGLGDGLVAFQQGTLGDAAIVATDVSTPPAESILTVPKGWIKPSQALISWTPAASANEPVTYSIVLDGHEIISAGPALAAAIPGQWLGSGIHHVQLLMTDRFGEQTLSPPSKLEIDAQPPTVTITRSGDTIVVRVKDPQSGVDAHAVSVKFGDGHRASGKKVFHHTYAHAGIYQVQVSVRNNVGNAAVVNERVSVR